MSSTFKCMSVNPVDKCMWMKIDVFIGVEYGKKYPSDQSAYNKSILWYNKERSIILYATDKRIFSPDKVKKYFTHNIYRNSSNMGRKILIVFLFKKKRYQHYVQFIVHKTNNFFTFLYTLSKQRLLITQRQFTS